MAKPLVAGMRPNRWTGSRRESSVSPRLRTPARAGQIGPIRREIIFEPVHEQPAPAEAPPVTPEPQPQEPVPDRS